MNSILRNILAVIGGIVIGVIVNLGLVMVGGALIPPPDGVDIMDMESIAASLHLFGPKHFVFPFFAHALGTLAGAAVAALIATSRKMRYALGIGVFFLIGGITNVMMVPSPTWFVILDLVVAYIPMGWLGGRLIDSKQVRVG